MREVRGGPFGEDPAAGAADPRGAVDHRAGERVRAGGGCPPECQVRRRASPVPTDLLGFVPERNA